MTTEQLYEELKYVNHSRENRLKYAHLVIDNPEIIPKVLDILFQVDDKRSPRAAWLLEFVARDQLELILPYLDRIMSEMHKVHLDSAVRPMAKICECLTEDYYSKGDNKVKQYLQPKHKEHIIECCFDWMISDEKIAPKAYSMNSLYLLGTEYDWIHPELVLILERDFQIQSSGFKARAKHIIKKIKASKH
ncbi:MAG: adenylosuccinate lyase [Acidimicrobiia bacterium]|nr:adenylosuccinate lyase [Acidimicrobiia bacterium]